MVNRNLLYNAEHFIGESPEIRRVFETAQEAARRDVSVLLTGESGTGKDLIAGAIHYNSIRADGPLVEVDCGGISPERLDDTLFGKTDGVTVFDRAAGGTLYLDGIDSLSDYMQEKLADRLIDNHVYGETGAFRVVASTHLDLVNEVENSRFMEDLYSEVTGMVIHIPPLRERQGDVVLLTYFFLKKFYGDLQKRVKGINLLAIKYLTNYSWPGNIRELEKTIKRAVEMARGDLITPVDLDIPLKNIVDWKHENLSIPIGGIKLEELEKNLILQALRMCDGVKQDTASLLGLSMGGFRKRIRRYGITHPTWKRVHTRSGEIRERGRSGSSGNRTS